MDNLPGLLADHQIARLAEAGMIEPFVREGRRTDDHGQRVISYGLSHAGYDLRLSPRFATPRKRPLDPKSADGAFDFFTKEEPVLLRPGGFLLANTVERVKMPPDILGVIVGKSTYARCGLVVNTTPIEPGWEGYITLELSNTAPVDIVLYPGEGICQLLLFRTSSCCKTSYADKGGKYQGQAAEPIPPRM